MRTHIIIFVNGHLHHVAGADAFNTLSTWLRQTLKLTGTKIVCSEGDCGSCSVLCGKLNHAGDDGAVQYFPIDSCIRFVWQLDGCHIVTVEGLQGPSGTAGTHPVQQAMIDCHGSQCGFCTPGFVVAMAGVLEQCDAPKTGDWRSGLTGNLCRCTGYSPIITAAQQAAEVGGPRIDELYPPAPMVKTARDQQSDEIQIVTSEDDARTVYCPTTIEQALAFLGDNHDATIVAGATDVGVWYNKGRTDL